MPDLSIKNKIEDLQMIAEFIEQFATDNNLNQKTAFELNLVLDEIITNTIEYGFADTESHQIDILIERERNNIQIQITDDGKKFNPLKKEGVNKDLPLQEKPIGGLGIFFVKEKVDKITYKRIEGKNILSITKNINPLGATNES